MVDTYVSGAYGFSVWVQVPSPTLYLIESSKQDSILVFKSFLRVQRERAEAGVLLFEVIKSLKTKHGIAVTSERPRQVPSSLLHRGLVFMHCRRVLEPRFLRC